MQLKKEVSSKELAEKAIQTLQLEMSESDCENENDLDFRAEDQLDEKGSPALRPLRHFGRTGRRAVVRVEEGEPDVLEVDHVDLVKQVEPDVLEVDHVELVKQVEPDVLEVDHVELVKQVGQVDSGVGREVKDQDQGEDSQCSDEQPRIPTKLSTLGQVRI